MRRPLTLGALALSLLAAVVLASLWAPGAAEAQPRFDPQFFHPAPMQRSNPTGMYSADVIGDAAFEIGALGHYDHQPLVLRDPNGDALYNIVGHQSRLHLMGGFGLFNILEIGADIPFILSQEGDAIPTIPNHDLGAPMAGGGVGDVRLMAKVQFFTTHTAESPGGAAMALVVEGLFPTGEQQLYQGDDWRIAPRLILDGITSEGHRVSLSLGVTYRQEYSLGADPAGGPSLEVGSTFDWGFAAHFRTQYVHVVPEIRGAVVMVADEVGFEEIPMEGGLSVRILPIEQLQIQLGGSVGLFQGFGAPVFRALLGVSWLQAPDPDRDGDGIMDSSDQCPDDPEDRDQFEDDDGCPDTDNDADGILDEPDQCPNVAEDMDEFEDENGCPDPDNDQDGILDTPDECPLEAEDMDQFEDADGCPDPDNDQDGVLDTPDECPNEPEDMDGFEDDNGCPDPDNDQDGILDTPDQCPDEPEDMNGVDDEDGCPEVDSDGDGLLDPVDQCPQQPEDMDGFEDEDGCPDPDNDQDGILDGPDQCPNEPEAVNGFEDEDGCPDEAVIEVTCNAIVIRDSIFFETNRDVIRDVSFELLNQIAAVMTARPDITRISVEGHTDSRGSDRHNLDLSTRRAASVRTYLMNHGIAESRLVSRGWGEARPIDSNRTNSGRAANRRVEFVIVEQEGCQDEEPAAVP